MLLKVKELTPKANHPLLKAKKDNNQACQELPEGRAEEIMIMQWSIHTQVQCTSICQPQGTGGLAV